MSDTYTLIIPSNDFDAMNAFGEALVKIARVNGFTGETSVKYDSIQHNHVSINTPRTEGRVISSGEVQLGDQSCPEAPLALTGDERYPTDQFVYMYDAVNDAYSLGRSDSEIADYESQGLVRHTAEQQAAWRDAGTSAELDVNGLPWDARIHAASKARNADDSWRVRRTPKDKTPEQWTEYYDEVITELKQLMEIPIMGEVEQPDGDVLLPAPPVETVLEALDGLFGAAPVPPLLTGDETHVTTVCYGESIPVPPPAAEVFIPAPPVVVPPPVTTAETVTFPQLMTWLTARHGKITVEQINSVVSSHGLPALQNLAQRPDLIPQVIAELRVMVGE